MIAKRLDGRPAELFAVPLDPPAPVLRPALPEARGTLPKFTEPATGADLSADGRFLAVCGPLVVRVYRREGTGWGLVATVRHAAPDTEAIAWDGRDLIVVGESRAVYRVSERAWTEAAEKRKEGRSALPKRFRTR